MISYIVGMQFITPSLYFGASWNSFVRRIRSLPCPHCSKKGRLIRHGSLTGKDLYKPTRIIRGVRFLCSNRNKARGCGKTFSLLLDTFLPRLSIPSAKLTSFLESFLHKTSLHQAWNEHLLPFSLRSAKRWLGKMRDNLARVRPKIHEALSPSFTQNLPAMEETLSLLHTLFPDNFISRFQSSFQIPFFA